MAAQHSVNQLMRRTRGHLPSLLGLVTVLAGCTHTDTFYLRDAALSDQTYLQDFEARERDFGREALGLYAHRLGPGSGLVLGYRWYSPGSIFTIDDERFEKITVRFSDANAVENRSFVLPSPSVSVIFTRGGSAWPAAACSGWLSSGSIHIKPSGTRLLVEVSGALTPATGECPSEVSHSFWSAPLSGFADLTPWLGAKGDHPYNESYRR